MKIPEDWNKIYNLWKFGEIRPAEARRRSGLKKSTLYKLVKLTKDGGLK